MFTEFAVTVGGFLLSTAVVSAFSSKHKDFEIYMSACWLVVAVLTYTESFSALADLISGG